MKEKNQTTLIFTVVQRKGRDTTDNNNSNSNETMQTEFIDLYKMCARIVYLCIPYVSNAAILLNAYKNHSIRIVRLFCF